MITLQILQSIFIFSFLISLSFCDNSSSSGTSELLMSAFSDFGVTATNDTSTKGSSLSTPTTTTTTNTKPTTTTTTTTTSAADRSNTTSGGNSAESTADPLLNLDAPEKIVSYTTKQKTIFIVSCSSTFVLLIALAILSGLSDTIARSRQKAKRTHA